MGGQGKDGVAVEPPPPVLSSCLTVLAGPHNTPPRPLHPRPCLPAPPDVVAVPALLSVLFHAVWIVVLLVLALASAEWPRLDHCESHEGVQYVVLFAALLAVFAANLAIDVLLAATSLHGAPFEASKRHWVEPLLYAATVPLVATLCFTVWGSYVCTQLEPDCWPIADRNAGERAGAGGQPRPG